MEIKPPIFTLAFDGSEGQRHILTMAKESLVPIVYHWVGSRAFLNILEKRGIYLVIHPIS